MNKRYRSIEFCAGDPGILLKSKLTIITGEVEEARKRISNRHQNTCNKINYPEDAQRGCSTEHFAYKLAQQVNSLGRVDIDGFTGSYPIVLFIDKEDVLLEIISNYIRESKIELVNDNFNGHMSFKEEKVCMYEAVLHCHGKVLRFKEIKFTMEDGLTSPSTDQIQSDVYNRSIELLEAYAEGYRVKFKNNDLSLEVSDINIIMGACAQAMKDIKQDDYFTLIQFPENGIDEWNQLEFATSIVNKVKEGTKPIIIFTNSDMIVGKISNFVLQSKFNWDESNIMGGLFLYEWQVRMFEIRSGNGSYQCDDLKFSVEEGLPRPSGSEHRSCLKCDASCASEGFAEGLLYDESVDLLGLYNKNKLLKGGNENE